MSRRANSRLDETFFVLRYFMVCRIGNRVAKSSQAVQYRCN
jgi:hypothetical protein